MALHGRCLNVGRIVRGRRRVHVVLRGRTYRRITRPCAIERKQGRASVITSTALPDATGVSEVYGGIEGIGEAGLASEGQGWAIQVGLLMNPCLLRLPSWGPWTRHARLGFRLRVGLMLLSAYRDIRLSPTEIEYEKSHSYHYK